MSTQLSDTPLRPDEQLASATSELIPPPGARPPSVFWPWLGGSLLVGVVIVGVVTYATWNWLNSVQQGIAANQPAYTLTTLNVQRSSLYEGLNITLVNVEYAPSFGDDVVHTGPATVRVDLRIHNPTSAAVAIAYYDVARLLAPHLQPIAPANLNLAGTLAAGATISGWLDFPVRGQMALNSLRLQIGNATTHEQLVTIPVSGPFHGNQFSSRTYRPALTVNYYFKGWQLPGYYLTYHLSGVEVLYAYNGVQVSAGQQFYILFFSVDNPNGADVHPGWGNDYIRLRFSSLHTPVDSTLPSDFKPNARHITGHVAFVAPANLQALTIVFLRQAIAGGDPYPISW
jgi:hypothetical protein